MSVEPLLWSLLVVVVGGVEFGWGDPEGNNWFIIINGSPKNVLHIIFNLSSRRYSCNKTFFGWTLIYLLSGGKPFLPRLNSPWIESACSSSSIKVSTMRFMVEKKHIDGNILTSSHWMMCEKHHRSLFLSGSLSSMYSFHAFTPEPVIPHKTSSLSWIYYCWLYWILQFQLFDFNNSTTTKNM